MLRKALALCLILVPGLSGTMVAFAGGGFVAEEPPAISGAPYSAVAVTQSTTTFSDGNRIVRTNTVRYFRDGQGRTRVERPVGGEGGAGSQSNVMITVTDPVSGQLYFIRPESKSVEAIKLSPQLIAAQAGHLQARTDGQVPFALLGIGMGIGASLSTEAATSEISLGQKSVNGVNATGTRIVRTFPAGVLGNEKPVTSTVDQWLSADLRVPVQVTQKSSIGGEISLNLTQLVQGEPDATLFAPPAGYTVHQMPAAMGGVVSGAAGATASATSTATATTSTQP
jgi:hypothetical protein